MATEREVSIITVGGKDSSLSSSSVYAIANNLSKLRIDSSALEKLSSSTSVTVSLSSSNQNPKYLTLEESRASLIVLLNKLLNTQIGIRPIIPNFIANALNSGFRKEELDFGSVFGFLESLFRLNGTKIEDTGVTGGELDVLKNSVKGLEGICAILEYSSSTLYMVADSVAALSCEASKGDVSSVFKFLDSGDGLGKKDESAVASDFKVLLAGSKLVGKIESDAISKIPKIHGGFRKVINSVHLELRSELNSVVRNGEALTPEILSLALWLLVFGESSLGRTKLVCDSITDVDFRSSVLEIISKICPSLGSLEDVYGTAVAAVRVDATAFFHEVYNLLVKVREVVTWEGAAALLLLDLNETSEKTKAVSVVPSRVEGVNSEKRSEKKKKVVLGKGTALVRQLLKDRLKSDDGESCNNSEILKEWVKELSSFFDPKELQVDIFLKKLKDIVESNESRRLPKLPKGTRDFAKEQMTIREKAFSVIEKIFKKHGATALDTPAFEMKETLMGKYGEDSKLIYDLADQGGELCSLRYDLTVPFARYVAMNVMGPDFEVVKVLTELLDELKIGDYEIKLNHRKLLDGMLEICGVPADKFRTISSSIDKLDKQSFDQIKKEMVGEKGLTVEVADKIGNYVKKRGPPLEILSELKQDGSQFLKNKGSLLALNELEILFKALEKSKCIHRVVFDLSLARGLDYYTGVIFEAVGKGTTQVGSIAAGGRYDNLVERFGTKQVSAVGVSLGIERVFTIMEQLIKDSNQDVRATETEVLVGILGDDLSQAAELVNELWDADLKSEFMVHKRVMKLIDRAKESKIPWMVIMGDKERNEGVVKLKNINANQEEEIARDRIVEELKKRLNETEVYQNHLNMSLARKAWFIIVSYGAVEAVKGQELLNMNWAVMSVNQHAKTNCNLLRNVSTTSPPRNMMRRKNDNGQRLKQSEESLRKIMYLSCWGPN
ncbi:Histidine--tRNA ligase, cytoplasmic [Thalictrum thalictroides]|uniref:histidine--tRNA ligase n=1 Tax=Thalictrum thalictroides TaxID=46969 RepID=A0A7J6V2D9_THATH|nr:Histidine--tRNA ligase, cytoplasmic [Thalictrum thalictroides]